MAERAPRRRPGHTRLFVYGTLLRGFGNHRLLAGGRFIGPDRTPPRYALADLGGYPAVVAGGASAVVGEIWEVDAAALVQVDQLEGHPRWYQRTTITLASHRRADTYLMAAEKVAGRRVVADGDWRAEIGRKHQALPACGPRSDSDR